MNRRPTPLALCLALLLSRVPALHAAEWSGWITDESCGAKGANRSHKECALKCHRGGALLVFFDNASGRIYKLDDQAAAEENLGHEVRVRGDLSGDTLRVAAIEPAG